MSTLLDHWRHLGRIASDSRLARADVAVAWHLLELFNQSKGYAYPSLPFLGRLTGTHRTTVAAAVSRLVRYKYFARVSGGGRNIANRYRPLLISGDAERNSSADAIDSVDATVSQPDETVAPTHGNSSAYARKRSRRRYPTKAEEPTEEPPEGAPARERGDAAGSMKGRKPGHGEAGGKDHARRLTEYRPPATLLSWAQRYPEIDPLDERLLGAFVDWHLSKGKYPRNLDAAYRNWIRKQAEFDERDRQHGKGGSTPLMEAALKNAKDAHR